MLQSQVIRWTTGGFATQKAGALSIYDQDVAPLEIYRYLRNQQSYSFRAFRELMN
jgi:hypothetical protein